MHVHRSLKPAALLPTDSLQALDWLNFFLAALLMGFGPFITVYLAGRGWVPESIGFVLTASGLAGLLTQVPGGELIDAVNAKRAVVGTATAAVILVILIYRLLPDFPAVFAAATIQGVAGSLLGPGVAAISLGLVGHEALAERLGRNQLFASIGGLTAAGIMGIVGYFLPIQDILLVAAALGFHCFWRSSGYAPPTFTSAGLAALRITMAPNRRGLAAPISSKTAASSPLPFAFFCSKSQTPRSCR